MNNKAPRRQKIAGVPRIGVKRDIESQPQSRQKLVAAYGPFAETFLQKYMDSDKKQVDATFGIRYDNGVPMIGGKVIMIVGDNIVIDDDDEVYVGTAGLWSLVTDKVPKNYDERDMERYKELLHETSALYQDYDPYNKYLRASRSKKWTNILGTIWNEFQFTGLMSEDSDDETLQGDDENDSDEEEYHDSSSILDNDKSRESGDGLKMYLQKNGRCFDVQRSGKGIKFNPRPRLAGIRVNGLYQASIMGFTTWFTTWTSESVQKNPYIGLVIVKGNIKVEHNLL